MMTASSGSHTQPQERIVRAIPHLPNPFEFLLAQEQLNKFRALDGAALRDVGLTLADVENAALADFANMPHHR